MNIQIVSDQEFSLNKGGHSMTLLRNEWGWCMLTHNASTRAWGGVFGNSRLASMKQFKTLAEVEQHYKSWRGVSTLIA